MPKKTRKDKILAQERRRQAVLKSIQSRSELSTKPPRTASPPIAVSTSLHRPNPQSNAEDLRIVQHFRRDFRKSLIIIGFIIALEIVIYFGTINNLGTNFGF